METIIISGQTKTLFGRRKSDGQLVYLTKPKWDCGWYWSCGYLGNRNEHFHFDSMHKMHENSNKSLYNFIQDEYELEPHIEENFWEFMELMMTAYKLKETAEVLGRGGAHYTDNPLSELIKDTDYVKKINRVTLPAIFERIQELLTRSKDFEVEVVQTVTKTIKVQASNKAEAEKIVLREAKANRNSHLLKDTDFTVNAV